MKKKKVLVTGAGGYIGRHVVKTLLDLGMEVSAVDIRLDGIDQRAELIEMSLFDGDEDIYEKLGKPDVCIHMAWRNGFNHAADSHMEDLSAHYTFVKNMVAGGLPSLSVMGSMHEVGYWEGAIDENTPTNPRSMYGISKNALRQAAFLLGENKTNIKWLRAYYILGDDERSGSIFGKIIKWEREGQEKFPFTSGKNRYDFITVDELAKQIACASIQDEVSGIINCCTGKPVSLADRVMQFIEEHNFKIRPEYGAFPDRAYDSPEIYGDATKINKIMSKWS
ncbi:NAD-dependent epimerase/dehydratase family protein [Ohessyouella blattaphilus]|uniref:NAD(P)-dependent oxidoreductase n=1 Tax=Ohessyouella blattaphilus TaxID=2949333 RepID=A0ABT1EDA4_9FIRM|nr:NAD(P)-dependent oxidoreductase [Ohessyouella blattaphilus]MCP1108675.1 NAD(P)-dependent oxidoreductase [Ohessyouella blattaphilus]MCR8562069.1 NAD(P)-dependent oxidoreductase [Ohessyouella blattaphilus]